ncbi:MAG: class I SAM-dependent methyltransferase [bacterium]|jgi:SAM-dependent methyltransferase|nr:class I SAM-dependent methyltransferase [Rhodocyclaceae bacterium]
MTSHAPASPSPWVTCWGAEVTTGPVLDLACGSGRHARWFVAHGLPVVAVDRQRPGTSGPDDLCNLPGVEFIQADLEDGSPWPLGERRFAAIVVTNYLHRPLFPLIAGALAEGGLLIYETFMVGNERFGRPTNPAFLLRPGELREAFSGLTVVAFEEGETGSPKPAMVQRVVMRRPCDELKSM